MSRTDICPDCNGTGEFTRQATVVDGIAYPAVTCKCETCDGDGVVCEFCGMQLLKCECDFD